MAVRARGREAYAGNVPATKSGQLLPLAIGGGVLAATMALGYILEYEAVLHGVEQGLRRAGEVPNQAMSPRGLPVPGLAAKVQRVSWPGGDRYGVVSGGGAIERTFPLTPKGKAKAERTAVYINDQGRIVEPGERSGRKSKPAQSAGTPSPAGVSRPWRRSGKVTGMQG